MDIEAHICKQNTISQPKQIKLFMNGLKLCPIVKCTCFSRFNTSIITAFKHHLTLVNDPNTAIFTLYSNPYIYYTIKPSRELAPMSYER